MKKYLILIIAAISLGSCNEDFLDRKFENNQVYLNFFANEKDVQAAVNAAYTPLARGGMFGLHYYMIFNTLDPYIWFENPSTGYDIMKIDALDNFIYDRVYYNSGNWQDLYRGLFWTSDILKNLNDPKKNILNFLSQEQLNVYIAQMKALQGMYLFYLVVIYDKPIYYDEVSLPSDPIQTYSNGDPAQFWKKIEEDFTFAASTLPPAWDDANVGRITKGGANAMLGKALLYKHYHYYLRHGQEGSAEAKQNLQKAKKAFKDVMDSNLYVLTAPQAETKKDYEFAFLSNFSHENLPVEDRIYKAENNAESVWEIQYNGDSRGNSGWLPAGEWGGNLLYLYFGPNNYRNHELDPSLWYAFDPTTTADKASSLGYDRDPRVYATCYLDGDMMDWRPESGFNVPFNGDKINVKKVVVEQLGVPIDQMPKKSNGIGIKKGYYPQMMPKDGNNLPYSTPNNARIIRYADVLLMYAETCYQLGEDAASGLDAINQVRRRVGMHDKATLDAKTIKHERDLELATEGLRWFDIIRWKYDSRFDIDLNTLFRGYFTYPKNMYFPLPQAEIDINRGALKQNPGY